MIDWGNICEACKIMDKYCTIGTLDRLFIAVNVELVDMEDNPDKSLCRFELLELLIRIAGAKYKDPKICSTYSESLERLLDDHFIPYCEDLEWQEFRDDELWCLECSDILECNLEGLLKLYKKYLHPLKKSMTSEGIVKLFSKDSVVSLPEKDSVWCFGMSKMTVVDELTQSK